MELQTPVHCNLLARWTNGEPVSSEQHHVFGEYTSHWTDVRDATWIRARLSNLLDTMVTASDHAAPALALRLVIESAAQAGGSLDLSNSKAGPLLFNLPPELMRLLEEACDQIGQPLLRLVLPPRLDGLPNCISGLQHLSHIQADAPGSGAFDLTSFHALQHLHLSNVPWTAEIRLDTPEGCDVVATYSDNQPANMTQNMAPGGCRTHKIVARAQNFNHTTSFPNGTYIECRHISLNVIGSWAFQDSLPALARTMFKPLWRVSSPSRIALTTPWELDGMFRELRERPVNAHFVRLQNWPHFLRTMLNGMELSGVSTKYMLLSSMRHVTCLRLVAGESAGTGAIEHFDPNYTTMSVKLPAPCNFIAMFANAQYFDVVYAIETPESSDGDEHVAVADFAHVMIIPDPMNLRSGVARKDKDIKISFEFADLNDTMSPALVADACREGHSSFLQRLANHIKANPLTREECLPLLRAQVLVGYPLMYRAANKGNAAMVHELGLCIHAAFTKGILTTKDVFDLVSSESADRGPLLAAMAGGHVAVIKAYGDMLRMLFEAKALNQAQVKSLMLGRVGSVLPTLDVEEPDVRKAYKAVLEKLLKAGALTKEAVEAIHERVF